jgi:hypothetical protein
MSTGSTEEVAAAGADEAGDGFMAVRLWTGMHLLMQLEGHRRMTRFVTCSAPRVMLCTPQLAPKR